MIMETLLLDNRNYLKSINNKIYFFSLFRYNFLQKIRENTKTNKISPYLNNISKLISLGLQTFFLIRI